MANKTHFIGFKTTSEAKEKLNKQVANLGILTKTGRPNISGCIRWLLDKSHYPLCREKYENLTEHNLNLIKIGGLLNQTLYHLNREIRVLNDKGLHNENCQTTLKSLSQLEAYYNSLKKEIDEQKKTLQHIVNIEGV